MHQSLTSDIKDRSLVSSLGGRAGEGVAKEMFSHKAKFESRPKTNEEKKSYRYLGRTQDILSYRICIIFYITINLT